MIVCYENNQNNISPLTRWRRRLGLTVYGLAKQVRPKFAIERMWAIENCETGLLHPTCKWLQGVWLIADEYGDSSLQELQSQWFEKQEDQRPNKSFIGVRFQFVHGAVR